MEKPKKINNLLALLILAVLLIVFFFPVAIQQKTFITTGLIQSDLMNHSFPLRAAYAQALKEGRLLLWSDKIGNGFPVFAEGQTGELYPLNLVFFKFLPILQAYNYSLLVHYLLAAFLTYLFVRKILQLGFLSGLLAGLAYCLSGFFMTHLVHPAMIQVASYLPLNFLLVEKIISQKSKSGPILGLALVLTLQALAGHHELLYFSLVFLFLYLLIRTLQTSKKNFLRLYLGALGRVSLAGFLALGLSATQIFPTLELIQFSTRKTGLSYQESTFYRFPLDHLLAFVNPKKLRFSETVDYTSQFPDAINLWETYGYLGLLPLVLAGTTVLLKTKAILKKDDKKTQSPVSSPLTSTFLILLVFSLVFALGRSTPIFKLLWLITPGMKLFKYPTRFLVFTEFSLALLAAIGLDSLIQLMNPPPARRTSTVRASTELSRMSSVEPPGVPLTIPTASCWGRLLTRLRYSDVHRDGASLRREATEIRLAAVVIKPKTLPTQRSLKHLVLRIIQPLVVLLAFIDLFWINRPINPTVDPEQWLQPPATGLYLSGHLGDYRFHSLGTNFFDYSLIDDFDTQLDLKNLLPANFNLFFELKSNDVLTGLLVSRHTQLNKEVPEINFTFDRNAQELIPTLAWMRAVSLQAVNYLLFPIPIDHPDLILEKTIPFKKDLNLNLYVAGKDGYEHEKLSAKGVFIYRNKQSFPRTFVVPQFIVTPKKDKEILPLLSSSEINFRNQVLLEKKPERTTNYQLPASRDSSGMPITNYQAEAKIAREAEEKITINTKSSQPGFLILADTFYPGWQAFIDNTPTEIYRANFAFRAIVFPPGDHQVVFTYQPLSFKIGALISLATGGGLVFYLSLKPRIRLKIFLCGLKTPASS